MLIYINTIALGRYADKYVLQNIASNTKGTYFYINNEIGLTQSDVEKQIDHINPRDKGGSNSYSNAKVLSRKENRQKWNK